MTQLDFVKKLFKYQNKVFEKEATFWLLLPAAIQPILGFNKLPKILNNFLIKPYKT